MMYPEKKDNEYPTYILKDTWDEPLPKVVRHKSYHATDKWLDDESPVNSVVSKKSELNADDLLKFLYEYVYTHFNQIGHYVPIGEKFESWWHRHNYGTSYQPIVQCCYIRKGRMLGFSVREHHS